MRLVKILFGQEIRRIKRRKDGIHVQLAGDSPGQGNYWVVVSPEVYVAQMQRRYLVAKVSSRRFLSGRPPTRCHVPDRNR
jgi:hypothetical protein